MFSLSYNNQKQNQNQFKIDFTDFFCTSSDGTFNTHTDGLLIDDTYLYSLNKDFLNHLTTNNFDNFNYFKQYLVRYNLLCNTVYCETKSTGNIALLRNISSSVNNDNINYDNIIELEINNNNLQDLIDKKIISYNFDILTINSQINRLIINLENVNTLVCSKCNIEYLDITKLINLETLICPFNKLIKLDLSNNINLLNLCCDYNCHLGILNLSNNQISDINILDIISSVNEVAKSSIFFI